MADLIGATVRGRSIASFLFGAKPLDPMTFGDVALLLALLATAVPGIRAARVDPLVIPRDE